MKKQPEVTERTRQRFLEAFWSLVREKPVAKISVSELTKRAGYNRSTFYEYFLDTDELFGAARAAKRDDFTGYVGKTFLGGHVSNYLCGHERENISAYGTERRFGFPGTGAVGDAPFFGGVCSRLEGHALLRLSDLLCKFRAVWPVATLE
ncbi:MAG: TetR/AcrR family transcriptional regulator [Oscillospiraceae bacterium]|nr:TetR/AcrR family transcriptional regulator [Oscillospiraceae bacterium]